MFDVNGIEDFYDKNALITYEVNGHEIPVHLKPKYTPQSQPMFPEYGHDTPLAAMAAARSHHSQNQQEHKTTTFYGLSEKDMPEYKVKDTPSVNSFTMMHHALPFNGHLPLGSNMQMGNTRFNTHGYQNNKLNIGPDSPHNENGQYPWRSESNFHAESTEHSQSEPSVDKLATEFAQAQAYEQQEVKEGNKLQAQYGMHHRVDLEPFQDHHIESEAQHAEYFQKPYSSDRYQGHYHHDEYTGKGQQHSSQPAEEHESNYPEEGKMETFNKPTDGKGYYNEKPSDTDHDYIRPSIEHEYYEKNNEHHSEFHESHNEHEEGKTSSHSDHSEYHEAAEITPSPEKAEQHLAESHIEDHSSESHPVDHPADQRHEDHPSSSEDSSSTKFFEQLEKIDQQKQKDGPEKSLEANSNLDTNLTSSSISEASSNTVQQFTDDSEKSKAKHKLLSILGDLTTKLKGMEEAVKDTAHTDERRENSPSSLVSQDEHNENDAHLQDISHSEHHEENKHSSEHKESYEQSSSPERTNAENHEFNSQGDQYPDHHVSNAPADNYAEHHGELQGAPPYEHALHNDDYHYKSTHEETTAGQQNRFDTPDREASYHSWAEERYKSHFAPEESVAAQNGPAQVQNNFVAAGHHQQMEQGHEELKLHPGQVSNLITKFRDHDKPFIFDTEGVDYKGPSHSESHFHNEESEHHPEQAHSNINQELVSEYRQASVLSPHRYSDYSEQNRLGHEITKSFSSRPSHELTESFSSGRPGHELADNFSEKQRLTPEIVESLSRADEHSDRRDNQNTPPPSHNEQESSYHQNERPAEETHSERPSEAVHHQDERPSVEEHNERPPESTYQQSERPSEESHTERPSETTYHHDDRPSEEPHTEKPSENTYHQGERPFEETHSERPPETNYHQEERPSEETHHHQSERAPEDKLYSNSNEEKKPVDVPGEIHKEEKGIVL